MIDAKLCVSKVRTNLLTLIVGIDETCETALVQVVWR